MSDKFNAIMPKLASRLRMLSSSADMEVLNAARALLQVLANAGLDIHALVERIQHGGGDEKLSAAEMQKIYDVAYAKGHADGAEQGRRSAVIAAAMPMGIIDTSNVGPGVNGYGWFKSRSTARPTRTAFTGTRTAILSTASIEQIAFAADPHATAGKVAARYFQCNGLAEGLNECSRLSKCASRWSTNGYTSIVPVIGKKPVLDQWQKTENVSRANARGLEPQLSERQQHRNSYQAGADARSRSALRAGGDRGREHGPGTL